MEVGKKKEAVVTDQMILGRDVVGAALVEDVLCPGSADAGRRVGVALLEDVSPIWY